MEPLRLYPEKWRVGVAVLLGLVIANQARRGISLADFDLGEMWLPGIVTLLGIAMAAWPAFRLLTGQPSFEADMDGFSVMGRERHDWSEFKGAEARRISYGILPVASYLSVRVKGRVLSRKMNVPTPFLSGPAREMAAQVLAYQKIAAMQKQLDQVTGLTTRQVPEQEQAAEVLRDHTRSGQAGAAPARPTMRPAAAPAVPDGPIRSTRTFGDRLFGRSEVL